MAAKSTKPFIDTKELTSTDFIAIFRKYDRDDELINVVAELCGNSPNSVKPLNGIIVASHTDPCLGNNYIEAKEIDAFMKDLFKMKYGSNYSKDKVMQLKDYIMNKYDKNHDQKLDITELAEILPVQENFLVKLQNRKTGSSLGSEPMSSVEFMRIWTNYDQYREGVLGRKELRGFIGDILQLNGHTMDPKADEPEKQVDWLLQKFDKDRDGEVSMTEIQGFLKVEDNFLKPFDIKEGHKIKDSEFSKIWYHYDKDRNGSIRGAELDALVRDLYIKLKKKAPDMKDINDWRDMIMRFSDKDGDEAVGKEEMNGFLTKGLSNALKRLK